MKLLEEMPSAGTQRPTRRRVGMTMTVTAVLVLVAAVGGAMLMLQSGDDEAAGTSTSAEWGAAATDVCDRVANEHPTLTEGSPGMDDRDGLTDAAAGIQALVTGVNDVAPPENDAAVDDVVSTGEQMQDAWSAVADDSAEPTEAMLTEARNLRTAFITGLTDLGADCAYLN